MREMPTLENPPEPPKRTPEEIEALKEQVIDMRPQVYRYCDNLLRQKDHALAEDFTQETMINAIRGLKNFRGEADLRAWVFRIARNVVFGHFRKIKVREGTANIVSIEDEDAKAELAELSGDASKIFDEALLKENLKKALDKLSEDDADIILSRIVGYTAEEIAADRKISLPAAKSRIHRAGLALKELMKDYAEKN